MKLTNKLSVIMLLATINFSTWAKADEIVIPVITKPAVLQEGTQRELTAAQIAELLPWAKDSKVFLNDLLDSTQGLTSADKLERLVEGLKNVVGESAPKNSELLMRYALNRGLVIVDILNKESAAENVGSIDAKNRVLNASIQMAIKYYDTDMKTLSQKSPAPFITFGVDYFTFLNELNKSIFDASAQYAIQRTSLEWLQWDLYRDLNNTTYAAQIVKINNSLKIFPTTKMSDAQAISYIRQMKSIASQLKIGSVPRLKDNSPVISSPSIGNTGIKTFTPSVNGININYDSDVNGACRAFGYDKGLAKDYSSSENILLVFNSQGAITSTSTGYMIKNLTCMGENSRRITLPKLELIEPSLDNIPFGYDSNSEGTCKILGYETAIPNSKSYGSTGAVIIANANGEIKSGESQGYKMTRLLCANKISSSPLLKATLFKKPEISNHALSYDSSELFACNNLGFQGAASGAKNYSSTSEPLIIIDNKGNVSGSTGGYKMTNLICIDSN